MLLCTGEELWELKKKKKKTQKKRRRRGGRIRKRRSGERNKGKKDCFHQIVGVGEFQVSK